MKELNPTWEFTCFEDNDMNYFMEKYFAGTSTLWGFNLIKDTFVIMKADMLRYCILYTLGGLYIDDDAFFDQPLDNFVKENSEAIISAERVGNIIKLRKLFKQNNTILKYLDHTDVLFQNLIIANWGFYFTSGHPFLKAIIEYFVDMIKLEYYNNSPYNDDFFVGWDKNNVVFCTTGPCMMTIALRKLLLANRDTNYTYTFFTDEFYSAGGRHGYMLGLKKFRNDPSYYQRKVMSSNSIHFLSSYAPKVEKSDKSQVVPEKWDGSIIVSNDVRDVCSYFPARYQNVTLNQCIRPYDDLLSNMIRKLKRWPECEPLPQFWYKLGMEKNFTSDDVFVDVGANIGSCSIVMAAHGIRTIAFEPMVSNLFFFTSSVKALPSESQLLVTIFKSGVGRASSAKKLYSDPQNAGHSIVGNLAVEPWRKKVMQTMNDTATMITISTLDAVLWPNRAFPPPSIRLMKMDIEGYETEALLGAAALFRARAIAMIKFEMATNWLHGQGSSAAQIFSVLKDYGYKVECFDPKVKDYILMNLESMKALDLRYPGEVFFQTECLGTPLRNEESI